MISSPRPPSSTLSPLFPVSVSLPDEPMTFSMLLKLSPSASPPVAVLDARSTVTRSEEHTSELQPLMRNSYAGFCLTKKKKTPRELCQTIKAKQNKTKNKQLHKPHMNRLHTP